MTLQAVEDRVAIVDGITAGLEEMDKADVAPPEPEVEAAPEEKQPETQEEDSAPPPLAPEEGSAPKVMRLKDTDIVVDPADDTEKTWGEVKAERLRHKDYTQKTMALADERRSIAEEKAQIAAMQEQARIVAEMAKLPELPEDDPYAQHMKAQQAQLAAVSKYQFEMAQQFEQRVAAREMEASRIALQAKEQQLMADHGLDKRELEQVEREYYHRSNIGETVDIDQIAKDHSAWKASLKEQAIKEFKTKHRTNAPAAAASIPAAAQDDERPQPGSRGIRERILEELSAFTG